MARHELVLVDSVQDNVHDRPLRSDFGPAAIGLRFRQGDGRGAAQTVNTVSGQTRAQKAQLVQPAASVSSTG